MTLNRAFFLAALLGLGACESAVVQDYRLRHPVTVTAESHSQTLSLNEGFDRFIPERDEPLARFLGHYLDYGSGPLTIFVPVAAFETERGQMMLGNLQDRLLAAGLLPAQMDWQRAANANPSQATLRFILNRVRAPACVGDQTVGHRTYNNETVDNFGCAQQRNIAVMAADPGDLVRMRQNNQPAAMDGAQAQRIIGQWRAGKTTESERGQQRPPATTINVGR